MAAALCIALLASHAAIVAAHAHVRRGAMAAVAVAIGVRPVGVLAARAARGTGDLRRTAAPIAVGPGPAIAAPGALVLVREVMFVTGKDPLIGVMARLGLGRHRATAAGA